MALPKPKQHENEEPTQQPEPFTPLIGPAERLRVIFEDLLADAPDDPDESGWEEFKRILDESRPEGSKLFPES